MKPKPKPDAISEWEELESSESFSETARSAVSEKDSFLIVNPRGALHECDRAHALERLKQVGWRLATPAEADAYRAARGAQRFDRPLTRPWRPLPTDPEFPD